jgi:predicted deacylase
VIKVSKRLIDVTGMRDVVQRRIPVMSLDSGVPGPTVWLSGCLHGDEPGGAVIIQDVFKHLQTGQLLRGAVHGLPLINSHGFEMVSRFINTDREDLNRCFPGNEKGTMGQRIARRLFRLIAKTEPDLVIDLHNDWIQSVPYVVLEHGDAFSGRGLHDRTIRLASATGLLLVGEPAVTDDTAHTLTGAMVAAGIPAFTVEAGGACGIVETSIGAGVASVLGVLESLEMTAPGVDGPRQQSSGAEVLRYTSRPRCTSSGILRFSVMPGDTVSDNQELAQVYSAFGSVEETIRAARSGYVLGVSDHARALPGAEVIAIAEFDQGSGGGDAAGDNDATSDNEVNVEA